MVTADPLVVPEGLVELLFDEINVNKTSGIDHLRCDVLKIALQNLVPQMTWLYRKSFNMGIFPDSWKEARVNPIPKPPTRTREFGLDFMCEQPSSAKASSELCTRLFISSPRTPLR